MQKGVLLVAAVVAGVLATVAVVFNPGSPTIQQPLSNQGGGGLDVSIPTIEVGWARIDASIVITVTRADPEKPLDCRWTAWVLDVTDDTIPFPGINLTNGVEPGGAPPGDGACTRTDPRLEFSDKDGDGMLSVGDQWTLHDVPAGRERNLEFVLTYWGTQEVRFRWGTAVTTAR